MYNAQDTIAECLTSLATQTIFKEMELILVDDFSSDNTIERAMDFEKQYPDNVLIIKLPENNGPGYARNVAMKYAQGTYIGFVDSDDAVKHDMYEHLFIEAVRSGADVVDGGLYNQAKDEAIIYTSDELTGTLDDHKRSILIVSGGYIWSKIYRREFLINENILFRDEYVLEDMDYLMEVFCKADKIANVKEIMYIYRDSGGSLSKTVDIEKYLHSTTSAMEAIYRKLSVLNGYEGIREAVEYSIIQLYSFSVNVCIKSVKEKRLNMEETLDILNLLRELKSALVRGSYNNQYVRNKIDSNDISIMMENDRSPVDLLKGYEIENDMP